MRRWSTSLVVLGVVVAGCGSGTRSSTRSASEGPPKPAATPTEFAARFARLTGVHLVARTDSLGTHLDAPSSATPDLFARLGVYSVAFAADESSRDIVLGGRHGKRPRAEEGIYWSRLDRDWDAAKLYGRRLALQWTGGRRKEVSPEFERLERTVRAAYLGDPNVLRAEERPCTIVGRDPLRSPPGSCSVDGVPVTWVPWRETLQVPALRGRVLGTITTATVADSGGLQPPARATGRFVVVAWSVQNTGSRPLPFVVPELRVGGTSFREAAAVAPLLPRSGTFPLRPGATLEGRSAFDLPPALAERARTEGAFVLPAAAAEGRPEPDTEFAQGWIQLTGAPPVLPATPPPRPRLPPVPRATPQPAPTGPPPIPFTIGHGRPIGGTARRVYTANSFFPVPPSFVPGGVRVGSRAAGCVVVAPTRGDRTGLLAAARRSSRKDRGTVRRLNDREILLADCGVEGRRALITWVVHRRAKGVLLVGDEFVRRRDRWIATPGPGYPGCRLPLAAAAAWQIDVSHCTRKRPPAARGRRSLRPA